MSEEENHKQILKEGLLHDLYETYDVIKSSKLYNNHLEEIDSNAILIYISISKLTRWADNIAQNLFDICNALENIQDSLNKIQRHKNL